MAIVTKSAAEYIAKRLSEVNYNSQIAEAVQNLGKAVEEFLHVNTPDSIKHVMDIYPEYFKFEEKIYLSAYNDAHARSYPKNRSKSVALKIPAVTFQRYAVSHNWEYLVFNDSNVHDLTKRVWELAWEQKDMCSRIECLLSKTLRSVKKLKIEFPEAYDVYLEYNKLPPETKEQPCDTVEAIRAKLKTNQNDVKKGL